MENNDINAFLVKEKDSYNAYNKNINEQIIVLTEEVLGIRSTARVLKISTTKLTVGEIAYQLGFEHLQSFNKLFKSKTNLSPLEFRQSFN